MPEPHNVFISWSGPRAERVAEALKQWLPLVVPLASPWISKEDIDKGVPWSDELTAALATMKAGIICVTPENQSKAWLIFEAGALYKPPDRNTRVWTYLLFGLTSGNVKGPLSKFQDTKAEDKEDTRKLIHSINRNLGAAEEEPRINKRFDTFWPELKQQLDATAAESTATPKPPTNDEMIKEIFELTRAAAQRQTTPQLTLTANELIEERSLIYRNLLAAYMKIQSLEHEKRTLAAGGAPPPAATAPTTD